LHLPVKTNVTATPNTVTSVSNDGVMMSLWHNYVIVTSYGELPPLNLAPYKSVSANSYRHVYTLHGLLYGNAIR